MIDISMKSSIKTSRIWGDTLRLIFVLGHPFMELNSAVNSLLYGSWLLNPLYSTYAAGRGFDFIKNTPITEPRLGWLMVLGGIFQLLCLIFFHYKLKAIATLGGVFAFSALAFSFFVSNIAGGGWIFVGLLALSEILAFIRHVGTKE